LCTTPDGIGFRYHETILRPRFEGYPAAGMITNLEPGLYGDSVTASDNVLITPAVGNLMPQPTLADWA
jgi:hypothetical protein